jgi:hypothetical protein
MGGLLYWDDLISAEGVGGLIGIEGSFGAS